MKPKRRVFTSMAVDPQTSFFLYSPPSKRSSSQSKVGAHRMLLKNLCGWSLCVFLIVALPFLCLAQELEPRRWSHLPTGANFAGAGYVYTEADISFDPILRIEDGKMELHTWAVKYIRTFELFEKSARIGLAQAYQRGRWHGLVDGVPKSVRRGGLSDSVMRFAVNLYGAPPLKGKEFAEYRAKVHDETIIGTALEVQLPTGEYQDGKLINLGTNRYTFRPQFGVVHNRGKWSMELTGSVYLYTDNKDFFDGNKLESDPFYTLQTHLVYNFRPGLWASAGAGYGYGGEDSVNGENKGDTKENIGWVFSFGYPITPYFGVKVAYLGIRSQKSIGQDSDSIGVAFSAFW